MSVYRADPDWIQGVDKSQPHLLYVFRQADLCIQSRQISRRRPRSTLFATQSELSHTLVEKKYKVKNKSVNKQGKSDIPDSEKLNCII